MTKICKRCGICRRETSFRTLKCRKGERGDICRICYDTNQLKEVKRTPEQIESQRKKLLGRTYSVEHRIAISNGQKIAVEEGRHPWKRNDNRHPEQDRNSLFCRIWKESVFKLRGKECEVCRKTDRLHVHHIKCYYDFPELRFDPKNGQVLCISCHMKWHRREDKTRR